MKAAARVAPVFRQALRPRPAACTAMAGPSSAPAPFLRAASTAAATAADNAAPAPMIPANVTFVDLAPPTKRQTAEALRAYGQPLHRVPEDAAAPIEQPLSSLASATPTAPASSGETVSLPREVFGKPLRKDILHRNVVWYLSTLREGNQSTKTRSTVAYSGKKMRPQKGSGRARLGDRGAGNVRGGAPIHPISPRDWAQDLPRKVRALGVATALSAKLNDGLVRVVANLNEGSWVGTNDAVRALGDGPSPAGDEYILRFGPRKDLSILFVHAPTKNMDDTQEFWRTVRNHPGIDLLPADEVEVYDLLKYRWVVLEAPAVDALAGDPLAGLDQAHISLSRNATEGAAARADAAEDDVVV